MRRAASVATAIAALLLLGSAGAAQAAGRRVHLSVRLPSTTGVARATVVAGTAAGAPAGAVAKLELRTGYRRWTRLAAAKVGRAGAYTLRWTPATAGFVYIRVVIARRGRLLAATTAAPLVIGAAPIYCAPPGPATNVPAGDGTIVGGVYNAGGPAPGVYVCQGQANVVGLSGASTATQQVPANGSYSFVVPAGSYTLSAGFCRGTATVTAGRTTHADTVCPVA